MATEEHYERIAFLLVAVATVASVIAFTARAAGHADEEASPIFGVKIPGGYRDWKLIAVAQLLVPGKADQLRATCLHKIAIMSSPITHPDYKNHSRKE